MFKINEAVYNEEHSDSYMNLAHQLYGLPPEQYKKEYDKFYDASFYSRKNIMKIHDTSEPLYCESHEFFRKIFGRQQMCVIYTGRFWVWTFKAGDTNAVLHALVGHRGKGVSFQYDTRHKNMDDNIKLMQEVTDHILYQAEIQ